MNTWERLFINGSDLPEERENVEVMQNSFLTQLDHLYLEKPDIASIFHNYQKCSVLGEAIPVQFLYCIFPVMPDMFRNLSLRQLWAIIQL